MNKQWDVIVNGTRHTIAYKTGIFSPSLIIDGNQTAKLKSKSYAAMLIDYPIYIEDNVLNLVVIGNSVDITQNGTFIGSGKPYVPVDNAPAWVNVMSIILVVVGFFVSGIFGGLVGVFASMLCMKASLKKANGLCIAIIIGAFLLQFLLKFFIAGIFISLRNIIQIL